MTPTPSNNARNRYYPSAKNSTEIQQAFRVLVDQIYGVQDSHDALKASIASPGSSASSSAVKQFQVNGSTPLNVTGLIGLLAQSQIAQFKTDILSNIPKTFGTGDKYTVFYASDVGHLFIWTGSAWAMTDGSGYGVFAMTTPNPAAFWTQIPTAGGNADVTNADGSGITSISFHSYSSIDAAYTLWIRK